nr:flavin reductase family protein [Micromonospora sp. DSM 115978]
MTVTEQMIGTADGAFDSSLLRRALGLFPSGVTAFCSLVDGEPMGMAASSFTSVSLEPPLVSVCVAHTSTTWERLAEQGRFGLSVLSSEHASVARMLSTRSQNRFADIDWVASAGGAVFIENAPLWLECVPYREIEAGDHVIVVLRVAALSMSPETDPIVFHRSNFRGFGPAVDLIR